MEGAGKPESPEKIPPARTRINKKLNLYMRRKRLVSRKPPETFRAGKPVLLHLFLKMEEVYATETSCKKGTSVHIKNMGTKQICHRKVRDFAIGLRARKVQVPGLSRNGSQIGESNLGAHH